MNHGNGIRNLALASASCVALTGLVAASAVGAEPGTPPLRPTGLTVNDSAAPLNVEGAPQFGWLPQDRDPGEVQTAFQVRVTDAGDGSMVWDSGRVVSDEQSFVSYAGPALAAGEDYGWTVRTWDATERPSPWAEPGTFETGISDADWQGAAWIRRDTTEADDYSLFRTEVEVTGSPVVRARAYTASNHTYELFLNGRRADRGASFGYAGEGYYQAADVTDLVPPGETLAIGVRNHWYGSGQGRPATQRGVLHKLVIEHADGTRQVVVSDGSWRVTRDTRFIAGAARRNGEGDRIDQQDARGAIAGWDGPGFGDAAWQPATVIGAHPNPVLPHVTGQETRIQETEVQATRLLTAADGTLVADFGKVIPARPQVHFDSGVAGRELTIRAGYELAADGRVATSTLATQGTNMSFPYIQVDGPQDYEAFTHLGFRYLEIPDPGEEIATSDVSAVLVHTDVPEGGEAEFTSSDETLNAVWDMMQRSAVYSVQEAFVDTPTREKGQFLGDAANISYATMQGFNERDATQQALREFLQSQRRFWATGIDAGRYNAVYPNGDGKRDIPDYSEMFVDWVWRYYEVTGDEALLAQAYPAIRETAGYVLRHIPETGPTAGLVTDLTGGSGAYRYGIIDWPEPGRFGYDMGSSARTVINALGVEVLRRTADMAEVLDRPASEGAEYRQAQTALVERMNERLRRADGVYIDGLYAESSQSAHAGQHSTSYAVAFGIAPKADWPALADHLAGMGMKQGPMTAHWLLQALSDAERPEAVLKLLTNQDDLGWADVLQRGGTFTWEAWTLDPGSNFSQSHGWGAQASVDVIESQLGIRLGAPGSSSVRIVPPSAGLEEAAGTVHTQRGPVSLDWTRTPNGMQAVLDVPVNVTARVELPLVEGMSYLSVGRSKARYIGTEDGRVVFEVGSGESRFVPVVEAAGFAGGPGTSG